MLPAAWLLLNSQCFVLLLLLVPLLLPLLCDEDKVHVSVHNNCGSSCRFRAQIGRHIVANGAPHTPPPHWLQNWILINQFFCPVFSASVSVRVWVSTRHSTIFLSASRHNQVFLYILHLFVSQISAINLTYCTIYSSAMFNLSLEPLLPSHIAPVWRIMFFIWCNTHIFFSSYFSMFVGRQLFCVPKRCPKKNCKKYENRP